MANPRWHRYFDDNDVNNWSILGFHETWLCQNKDDPKKLNYQKANDVITKSLCSLINNCKDEMKIQGAAKLLASKAKESTVCWSSECLLGCMATVVHARRNQLFAGPLNACLDPWLVTTPICVDNVTRYSCALTSAAVTNLCNIIPELTPTSPSKRPFESLEPEIINSAQVMGQESNENFNPQPEIMRTPLSTSLDEDTLLHTLNAPPMWTKIENYLENALKKSGRDFKKAIMLEIKGDDENKFCLYFASIFDDKEIWHMEVAGPPSPPTMDHGVGDTKKSLHSDILNLVALFA
nr:10296_t:CDS:2 [Entrophospora candida]